MITTKKILLFVFLLSSILSAQSGSVYSRFGVGDIHHSFSARRASMGGLGYAVKDNNHLNFLNPAAWYGLKMTRLEVGVNYFGTQTSNNNLINYFGEFDFGGFLLGFPIERDLGISVVAGLVPVTSVGYEIEDNTKVYNSERYTEAFSGSGGISKLFFGSSYETPLGIVIGASFDYYTGEIEYNSFLDFQESSSYRDAKLQKSLSYKGIGFNLGLISPDLSELLGSASITELKIGLGYRNSPTLSTDSTLINASLVGSVPVISGITETVLPGQLGIGLSFQLKDNWLFAIDYAILPWSKYKFNNKFKSELRDLQKISLGFEYKQTDARFASFWEQMLFRGGLTYEQTQLEINGYGIDQLSVSGGFSIPLSSDSAIDLGLLYGMRGTKENNLIQENIFQAFVTLSFGELWFVRQDR